MSVSLVGIMSAMPQEASSILSKIRNQEEVYVGKRKFIKGIFETTPIVFTLAGIGKVSAAATAALLHSEFKVKEIVFTGVAGGGDRCSIGDIVIGSSYLQHDLDLRPIFPQFHIYSLDTQLVYANADLVQKNDTNSLSIFTARCCFPIPWHYQPSSSCWNHH
jgi:adenosylhomocysteine nucleosidase